MDRMFKLIHLNYYLQKCQLCRKYSMKVLQHTWYTNQIMLSRGYTLETIYLQLMPTKCSSCNKFCFCRHSIGIFLIMTFKADYLYCPIWNMFRPYIRFSNSWWKRMIIVNLLCILFPHQTFQRDNSYEKQYRLYLY